MKTMKKIICAVLVVITLLSCITIFVSADNSNSDYVAKMYICARVTGVGHAWIYIENLTDHELKVGAYKLPVKQGVTVSQYNLKRNDGKGNYYNIDAYCLNKYGSSKTTSASMMLTESQLNTVSATITATNTYSGLKNCCWYVGRIWNSVAAKKLKVSLSPVVFISYIKKIKCATPSFYYPTKEQCFKQVGTGSSAGLKPCSNKSFNKNVG